MFHIINKDSLFHGIHNPIFPYAGGMVQRQFCIVIHRTAARRYNLDHPIRSPAASVVI